MCVRVMVCTVRGMTCVSLCGVMCGEVMLCVCVCVCVCVSV
jgi:hypothetical protein